MTIGTDTVFTDDFTRADNSSSLGASYTVQAADSDTVTFGVLSNQAEITASAGAGILKWAKISGALFGSADYTVKTAIDDGTSGNPQGVVVRLTTSGDVPTCYFVGKNGSNAFIQRYDAGTPTDLVAGTYIGAWDGGGAEEFSPHYLKIDVETISGNVSITLSSSTTENGTYTQRAQYTDTSGSKITGAGTAAIATTKVYDSGNRKKWDFLRVVGTAAGGGSAALEGAATASASATGALTIKKAKLRLDIAAAGEVVDGIVWANQGGAIAGAEIGEFTGQTIATGAGADAGFAVLKVPVTAFGGGALNVGDTVQMFVRNATKSSDLWPATIIEE